MVINDLDILQFTKYTAWEIVEEINTEWDLNGVLSKKDIIYKKYILN